MKTQKQINSTTYEDLLQGMASSNQYDHLKIILNASHNSNGKTSQKYLWVTPHDFGIARLMNVDYDDDQVILQLRDETNDTDTTYTIDVNVPDIKLLLVNLEDVKRLVMNDK
jgi:aromatic ring-opening dioxygenase LigB subunit